MSRVAVEVRFRDIDDHAFDILFSAPASPPPTIYVGAPFLQEALYVDDTRALTRAAGSFGDPTTPAAGERKRLQDLAAPARVRLAPEP
jgi:hypothetical protein